ncbi:DUF6115 domain-containing protein [Paramaledivibacter caminithermalis]|nr:hypothetical protein [Paramaledivibacter caminithermalis]
MISLIFLVIGILIIIISLFFIKNQRAETNSNKEYEEDNIELISSLESIEDIIDGINITFNNTIAQMEKKYKVLETKLEQVEMRTSESESIHKKAYNEKQCKPKNTNINSNSDVNHFNNNIVNENVTKEDKNTNNKSVKIKELYDKGMNIPQIAKSLNIGIGEVKLIINLKKAKVRNNLEV